MPVRAFLLRIAHEIARRRDRRGEASPRPEGRRGASKTAFPRGTLGTSDHGFDLHGANLLLLFAWTVAAPIVGTPAIGSGPLKVTSRIPHGPHHVGQAIEVVVDVEGGSGPLSFEPPRLAQAEIRALARDAHQPALARFLVIPARSGLLDLPPFRVRSGDRSGASRASRLTVASVPADGRPPAFLGGVGPFEVRAEAEPSSLLSGQTLEYRIKVTGPAAWGGDRAPDLAGWSALAPGFRIETLPGILEGVDPPARTFRYRLRPTKSGRVVLPPVAVAAFDPKTRRYVTRTTAGLPIRIDEPPRFDPARLDYPSNLSADEGRRLGLMAVSLGLGSVGLATLTLWLFKRKNRKLKQIHPRTLALELALVIGQASIAEDLEKAQAIAEALTTFLQRVDGRSQGVLTPLEALQGFERVTKDHDLAKSAEDLIRWCDRIRYRAGSEGAGGLVEEARGFFERIAELMGSSAKGSRVGGPREAVETVGE